MSGSLNALSEVVTPKHKHDTVQNERLTLSRLVAIPLAFIVTVVDAFF